MMLLLPIQPQKLALEIQKNHNFKARLLRTLRIDKFITWQFNRVLTRCLSTKTAIIKIFGFFKFNAKWLREFYYFNVRDYLVNINCPADVNHYERTKMRIDYNKIAPDAVTAMLGLEKYVNECSLEKSLIELIRLRASQINGCTYCVGVHRKSALKLGESENRLDAVSNWKGSSLFTDQERAVLDWTEAVTLLSESRVPDDIYNEVCNYFSEEKVVELTMIIITINSWNRLAVSFRKRSNLII